MSEPSITIRLYLSCWILHPVEEQRMLRTYTICCLCLLHCKTEERSLCVPHQPQPGPRFGIIEFYTTKFSSNTFATIETHSPEIIRGHFGFSMHNGCNTILVMVP